MENCKASLLQEFFQQVDTKSPTICELPVIHTFSEIKNPKPKIIQQLFLNTINVCIKGNQYKKSPKTTTTNPCALQSMHY